jgi:hypothetical protein
MYTLEAFDMGFWVAQALKLQLACVRFRFTVTWCSREPLATCQMSPTAPFSSPPLLWSCARCRRGTVVHRACSGQLLPHIDGEKQWDDCVTSLQC